MTGGRRLLWILAWPTVGWAAALSFSEKPSASVPFDGDLIDAVAAKPALSPSAGEFVPGRVGKALRIGEKSPRFHTPNGLDWQRGTVAMWIRSDTDCKDFTYRMFFEAERKSKSRVYLIKSGKGGANGLFMCVVDEAGKWMAASVFPGRGYRWRAGDWHHIAGSWDARRGLLKLFFDGKEVATTTVAPFRIGAMGDSFTIGDGPTGGNLFKGSVDEFRLYQGVATQSPIPSAKNVRGAKASAWRLIDGDKDDTAAWNGMGAPNWVEVELPEPIELARVVVYPGALRYSPHPSTECSPKQYVVEGWVGGKWQALSPPVLVPRYTGAGQRHRVATDLKPSTVRRFRLNISSIYDKGLRVSSPDKPIVPPEECSVVIREVEWQTAQQVAEAERRFTERRDRWRTEIGQWRRTLESAESTSVMAAVRRDYGQRLAAVEAALNDLSDHDPESLDAFGKRWGNLSKWLDPWKTLRGAASHPLAPVAAEDTVGVLTVEVDVDDSLHEFYPASMALDLEIVEAALAVSRQATKRPPLGPPVDGGKETREPRTQGPPPVHGGTDLAGVAGQGGAKGGLRRPSSAPVSTRIDPYRIRVVEIDARGKPVASDPAKKGPAAYLVPCRLDRITPTKGTLVWTLRDRRHTRFVVQFARRTDAPPPAMGNVTLGNCDRFFYRAAGKHCLPGNIWAASFVDWDRDGRQDVIAGRWTDYCHFWKNVGTKLKPAFAGREHWLVMDESERPIVAHADHPGLGFSVPMPVDFDGDGLFDIFLQRYYGDVPTFYRSLGPASFPIVAAGVKSVGLGAGRPAFGDLNGDGRPDAVVVRRSKDEDEIAFHAGEGLSHDGRPVFGPARALDTKPKRSQFSHCRTVPALGDLDGDGDLDLSFYCAPHVWVFDNVGTAQAFRFGKGRILERNGKPFEMNYYYPWIAWSDWDGDGDLDLVKCTGLMVYLNEGDAKTLRLGRAIRPTQVRQRAMGRAGLRAHAMADWDGDGDYDHVTLDWRGLDLRVSLWKDGLFEPSFAAKVDPNKRDWFGCPDPTEYYALYGNVKMVDWDCDGDLDLFVTSEHSWRFGYIHYYENLGEHRFGPEVELRPDAKCDHVKFVAGKNGSAAVLGEDADVDFVSFRTQGNFQPDAGTIRFWFKPNWDAGDGKAHCFFSTTQHPDTYGIGSQDLKHYYIGMKPELSKRLRPPFAASKTEDGKLRFQTWTGQIETGPLDWKADEWHQVEVGWGTSGRYIAIDGARRAESREPPKPAAIGARIHVGSSQTFMVQRKREYSSRRPYHPKDWTFIADGAFDDFEILDANGGALLTLPFDGNCDTAQGESGDRTTIGYRCTPGFGDLNGDGLNDMVTMIGDGTRFNTGQLYLFPNVGTRARPRLGQGVLLEHVGGEPFQCHVRTQATPIDWDGDGRIDIILSTENCGQQPNCAVDFFKNVGTPTKPIFALRQPMDKLNAMLEPHHEVKLCAVDLTGNGVEDLVTSTDPGTRVIYRSFLEEEPVYVKIIGMSSARHN